MEGFVEEVEVKWMIPPAAQSVYMFGEVVYLEGSSLDTLGLEEVVVGIEDGEFSWQHGQLYQSVLRQAQFLQQGQLGERPVLHLRNYVPRQVDPLQSHWKTREQHC